MLCHMHCKTGRSLYTHHSLHSESENGKLTPFYWTINGKKQRFLLRTIKENNYRILFIACFDARGKKKASRCSSGPFGVQYKPSERLTACQSWANYGHSDPERTVWCSGAAKEPGLQSLVSDLIITSWRLWRSSYDIQCMGIIIIIIGALSCSCMINENREENKSAGM